MHLNFTREEFLRSYPKEIITLWNIHVEFNDWKVKSDGSEDNRVYSIDELSWL
ncbi:hypothetical protein [Clostridium tunisiense]|uniref:hypothetical protein n=1 Tax=Clostridium tunisiense TaxID=219748 RepID=UPI0002FD2D45|nr:hypothetical protein [Clostridium tunisiense]